MRWQSASEATRWPQEQSQEAYGVCGDLQLWQTDGLWCDSNRCFSWSLSSDRFATGARDLAHGSGRPMTKILEDVRREQGWLWKAQPTSGKTVDRFDSVVHLGLNVLTVGARGKVVTSLLYNLQLCSSFWALCQAEKSQPLQTSPPLETSPQALKNIANLKHCPPS